VRITGGQMKGRRLKPPKGMHIRPTSDRVREAVFDILRQEFQGGRALDLFAGTGAMGLEALSRGVEKAVFVDKSDEALRLIRKNLEICGLTQSAAVLRYDLSRGVPRHPLLTPGGISLVFLDPPYGKGLLRGVLDGLARTRILAPDCTVVVETSADEEPPLEDGRFSVIKRRRYGGTIIHILGP